MPKKEKAWIAMSMRRPINDTTVEVIINNKVYKAHYSKDFVEPYWYILRDQNYDGNNTAWYLNSYITHWRALPTLIIN